MSKNEQEKNGFITEHIKPKPLEKKDLFTRMGLAVLLGVLFGLVAALAYTAGVYHLENTYFQPKPEQVVISNSESDVSQTDIESGEGVEIKIDQSELGKEAIVSDVTDTFPSDEESEKLEQLYGGAYRMAQSVARSLLPVSAISSDADWFTEEYESSKQGSGLVIADNRRELLILIEKSIIENADEIRVTLPDNTRVKATEKKYDPNIGFSIIGVELSDIKAETRKKIIPATMGVSTGSRLTGKPVVAVGSPLGEFDSFSYGIITSSTRSIQMRDKSVHVLTTNIYGSKHGSGILVDLKGETVGLITQDASESGAENLITAYGISDIKNSIERMSNGQDRAYLGIYGVDVTPEVNESLSIPLGVYVTKVEVGSPAMDVGIQTGDVITMVGTSEVESFTDYENVMNKSQPGDDAVVTILRASRGGYAEMTFDVKLATLK